LDDLLFTKSRPGCSEDCFSRGAPRASKSGGGGGGVEVERLRRRGSERGRNWELGREEGGRGILYRGGRN
jgi:hypothetical protein